jgi:hypothetical protein
VKDAVPQANILTPRTSCNVKIAQKDGYPNLVKRTAYSVMYAHWNSPMQQGLQCAKHVEIPLVNIGVESVQMGAQQLMAIVSAALQVIFESRNYSYHPAWSKVALDPAMPLKNKMVA